MNKTRGRIYWIIFVIFILVFILLAISHQQAAAEMAADRRYSFSLTLEPYDPSRQSTLQSQQESMYMSAWIVGFIIPAALMLISYFIHGCIYYNDKLDYIVDHEKPSYTRMMIQLLIAFMFIMITGTTSLPKMMMRTQNTSNKVQRILQMMRNIQAHLCRKYDKKDVLTVDKSSFSYCGSNVQN